MWESYKQDWSKQFSSSAEEAHHFQSFVENLRVIDQRNMIERKNNGTAIHGLTQFSDLSQEEFAARYLKADPSQRSGDRLVADITGEPDTTAALVDWSGKLTTPVKNQGYCGSCWAFSATEQIESDTIRTLGVSYILSPEQITQCDTTSHGCNGGWTENAYKYVTKAGGIETEQAYPYTSFSGTTGKCAVVASKEVIAVKSYATVVGESKMATYMQGTGPLSVCLDASSWNSYNSGIMKTCGKSVDHCVQAVGVDATSTGYWKVRNSWGTGWGESGYIRLAYGANTCNIANDATYVAVAKK